MRQSFLLINGQFEPEHEKIFSIAFFENILFCERMRAIRNQLPFWNEHLEIIELKLRLLNTELPYFLQRNGKELKRQIERTLTKNKYFKSSSVELYLFRANASVSYVIKTDPIASTNFKLNQTGLRACLYDKAPKDLSSLSSLDFGSMPFWKIANADQLKTRYDELILINNKQAILEAPGKNIYIILGNQVLTPSPACGSYIDPAQSAISKTLKKVGLELILGEDLKEETLLQADELFLANAITGIEWIKSFRQKRYFNKKIKLIHEEFNRLLLI